MALLVVLLVLVLGYYYAAHITAEQIKLRRSAGSRTALNFDWCNGLGDRGCAVIRRVMGI